MLRKEDLGLSLSLSSSGYQQQPAAFPCFPGNHWARLLSVDSSEGIYGPSYLDLVSNGADLEDRVLVLQRRDRRRRRRRTRRRRRGQRFRC